MQRITKNSLEGNRSKYLLAGLLWLTAVTVGSLVSVNLMPDVDSGFKHTDKLVHGLFYFVATILFYLHFRKTTQKRVVLKISLFCLGYGMIIEVLQWLMPFKRGFELADMLANTAGIVLAIILIKFVLPQPAR